MAMEVEVKTERVQKFLEDLEAQKTILSICSQLFTTLSNHFNSLQESFSLRSKSLESKLQSLESTSRQTLESLSQRESSIPDRESAAVTRIAEKKQVAVAEIDKPTSENAELLETLRSFTRKMDWRGLLNFINTRKKDSARLRSELPSVIAESIDPPRLVLDAVEGFLTDQSKKSRAMDRRWACGMLVQALFNESASNSGEKKGTLVPLFARNVSDRAGRLLELWKQRIDAGGDGGNEGGGAFGPAEAVMFLQIVVVFRLTSKFDEEFLKKLVLDFAARRDIARLANALPFGDKLADIIDELAKNGKEVEATYFAAESGMTERFSPVSLLKSYLKNSKRNATNILKNGNNSAAVSEESSNVELTSIKAVLRCVEDLKLEVEFPLETLRKRAGILEKAKAERKKSSVPSASKPATGKRPYGGGGSSSGGSSRGGGPPSRPSKAARFSSASRPSFASRGSGLPPQPSPVARYSSHSYNYPPPYSAYEVHGTIKYESAYSAALSRSAYAASASAPHHQQQYSPILDAAVAAVTGGAAGPRSPLYSHAGYDYTGYSPTEPTFPYPQQP